MVFYDDHDGKGADRGTRPDATARGTVSNEAQRPHLYLQQALTQARKDLRVEALKMEIDGTMANDPKRYNDALAEIQHDISLMELIDAHRDSAQWGVMRPATELLVPRAVVEGLQKRHEALQQLEFGFQPVYMHTRNNRDRLPDLDDKGYIQGATFLDADKHAGLSPAGQANYTKVEALTSMTIPVALPAEVPVAA